MEVYKSTFGLHTNLITDLSALTPFETSGFRACSIYVGRHFFHVLRKEKKDGEKTLEPIKTKSYYMNVKHKNNSYKYKVHVV